MHGENMQSPLLLKKKTLGPPPVLSIQFDSANVGDKAIIDNGTGARTFVRHVISGSPTDGVINDPTFGKCYQFTGLTYFDCANILQFSNKPYRLEIDFVPQSAAAAKVLFRSGDYNAHGNQPGLLINLNQTTQYYQCFLSTGTSFSRDYLGGVSYPGAVLEKMVMTKQNGFYTVLNNRTGVSTTYGDTAQPGDTYLAIGCSDDLSSTYAFIGLLKRLQLFLL